MQMEMLSRTMPARGGGPVVGLDSGVDAAAVPDRGRLLAAGIHPSARGQRHQPDTYRRNH
jgi:hypothetical protein